MRPASHREQIPERRCSNCKHCKRVLYKQHLLCFHGDQIEITYANSLGEQDVYLDGIDLSVSEGDEYDQIWCKRVVDWCDTCDEWEAEAC